MLVFPFVSTGCRPEFSCLKQQLSTKFSKAHSDMLGEHIDGATVVRSKFLC
jgi:hypothetical protein